MNCFCEAKKLRSRASATSELLNLVRRPDDRREESAAWLDTQCREFPDILGLQEFTQNLPNLVPLTARGYIQNNFVVVLTFCCTTTKLLYWYIYLTRACHMTNGLGFGKFNLCKQMPANRAVQTVNPLRLHCAKLLLAVVFRKLSYDTRKICVQASAKPLNLRFKEGQQL